jgi:hypothetical protein
VLDLANLRHALRHLFLSKKVFALLAPSSPGFIDTAVGSKGRVKKKEQRTHRLFVHADFFELVRRWHSALQYSCACFVAPSID